MSIDQNSIKNEEGIAEYLNIRGIEEQGIVYDNFLNNVWRVAKEIWKEVDLEQYTNHDVKGHSVQIIKYFGIFQKLFEWSSYEKLIFSVAAIIHDIGMQYNRWAPKISGFPVAPLDQIEIRKEHAKLGKLLVIEQLGKNSRIKYPPLFFQNNNEPEKTALHRASIIAFSHSSQGLVDELLHDEEGLYKSKSLGYSIFRPRLLAVILRICDELDCNYERIKSPNKIDTWYMNEVAKSHWLCCFFIEKIELEIRMTEDKKEIGIKTRWRVPREANEYQKDKIKNFIEKIRMTHIKEEIEFGQKFLIEKKEEFLDNIIVDPINKYPGLFEYTIEEDFDNVIDCAIETRYKNSGKKFDYIDNRNDENGKYYENIKSKGNTRNLKYELKEWFENNKEQGHFELKNNSEHTDTYLNCRTLVSNQELLRAIAHEIYLEHKGHTISCVLAVGTSAIPIAINVAYRLKSRITFTVDRSKVESKSKSIETERMKLKEAKKIDYNLGEIIPSIPLEGNLLIIDDVISGGNVAKIVLDNLNNFNATQRNIYHQSIFRLGEREYFKDQRIKKYSWLMYIKNVMYDKEETCVLCKNGEPLIKENEMY
jgi:orotate phosphoribosyltransferase